MGGGIPSMVKRGIHIYTKQTAAAFNCGCDSTAENLESPRTSSDESSD